ncbi:MAG: hypothetical protein ACYCX4_00490 [Bacillota bacterium]
MFNDNNSQSHGEEKRISIFVKYSEAKELSFNVENKVERIFTESLKEFSISQDQRTNYELRLNDGVLDQTAKIEDTAIVAGCTITLTTRKPGTEG